MCLCGIGATCIYGESCEQRWFKSAMALGVEHGSGPRGCHLRVSMGLCGSGAS